MNKKILIVFNTCRGINGQENPKIYIRNIKSILEQEYDNFELIWSSCFNSQACINEVMEELDGEISLCVINEKLSVQQTFNKSCREGMKHFGNFDGFIYVACDILFPETDSKILLKLSSRLNDPENGIIYPEINNDNGYYFWFDFPEEENLFDHFGKDKDFIVPIGCTANLHCALFSKKLFEEYDNVLNDTLVSYCGESIFHSLVAAIKQKFIITNDCLVYHRDSIDIRGQKVENVDGHTKVFGASGNKLFPGCSRTIEQIVRDPLAREVGLSYESFIERFKNKSEWENKPYLLPDKTKYDENGFALDKRLKEYIKENFFLSSDILDYDKINCLFLKKE